MRVLVVLTYYCPHVSGLTIYAERLARAFVRRGHQVTVLTSQYRKDLPREEILEGVRIVRVPVAFRISKGVIMPGFGRIARRLVRTHEVIHLHLPQFDAARVAWYARFLGKTTIGTYHCDLHLPPGLINRLADGMAGWMNWVAARLSHRIVAYTRDYAEYSRCTSRFLKKVEVVDPPVELPEASEEEAERYDIPPLLPGATPVIGMAARFATEKGIEILLAALPAILQVYPQALVRFAGPFQDIRGEEDYFRRLWPTIETFQQRRHWQFLGVLNPHQMTRFYRSIDLLVLPSLNSTEAFGLVQIEAMFHGVPCIASDLPGVRQPILRHGMGKIVPIGNPQALAQAVLEILLHRPIPSVGPQALRTQYAPDAIARKYEELIAGVSLKIQSS